MTRALPYRAALAAILLLPVFTRAAPAQRAQPPDPELPRVVAEEIVAYFNRPETIRIWGAAYIPSATVLDGDVAVLGGPLVLAGEVRGRVVVINGEVRLEPGSRIEGDLTVVGGAVAPVGQEVVTGQVVAFVPPLRYRRDDQRITYAPYPGEPALTAGRELGAGRVDFTASSRQGYNRVEGLPIWFGPRLELGRSNPTRLEALLIHRTETGLRLAPSEMGHALRLEQAFGGRHAWRAGVTLHSEIVPVEAWGLSNRETSLATFVLHRDYRDHYERDGHGVYLAVGSPARPTSFTLEYRDEDHRPVAPRGPWSLFGNNREWRPQPAVSSGRLQSLTARLRYDTRNVTGDASTGWFVTAALERGLGGTLTQPVVLDAESGEPEPGELAANTEYSTAFLDVRRYARLGPDSRVALRAVVAGSIDGEPLPVQRQHALGGEGSLPGYPLFTFDCGARAHTVELTDAATRFHPYYGCDRMVLMQLEYETRLPFASGLGHGLGWPLDAVQTPSGVVFVNAGRAWVEPGSRHGRSRGQDDFAADAGVGIRLGPLGFYWAVPLSGGEDGINFFVRIGSRF